jgi:hypothetical protein
MTETILKKLKDLATITVGLNDRCLIISNSIAQEQKDTKAGAQQTQKLSTSTAFNPI